MDDYIPKTDYKLIDFTNKSIDEIKRIKTYAKRNCRFDINQQYITSALTNFDFGFAFFRTEILKKTKESKNRPCAFICIREQNNNELFIILVCSIENTDKLGTKLINKVIEFAKNKGYIQISLESNLKNKSFYEKFDFFDTENLLIDNMYNMTKYI